MVASNELGSALDLKGKLLYIEDDPFNMALVECALLEYPGITLIRAQTGKEGVKLARAELPDFILLDMHLPDIDGLDVVRELNKDITSRKLRVTLLTGDTLSMDIVKAMSLGAYEYWLKPLDRVKFDSGLKRAFAAQARTA